MTGVVLAPSEFEAGVVLAQERKHFIKDAQVLQRLGSVAPASEAGFVVDHVLGEATQPPGCDLVRWHVVTVAPAASTGAIRLDHLATGRTGESWWGGTGRNSLRRFHPGCWRLVSSRMIQRPLRLE